MEETISFLRVEGLKIGFLSYTAICNSYFLTLATGSQSGILPLYLLLLREDIAADRAVFRRYSLRIQKLINSWAEPLPQVIIGLVRSYTSQSIASCLTLQRARPLFRPFGFWAGGGICINQFVLV